MIALLLTALLAAPARAAESSVTAAPAAVPTVAEAQAFMDRVEEDLDALNRRASFSAWVQQTDINYSTEWLAADASRAYAAEAAKLAKEARRYEALDLPPALARKFLKLKLTVDAPAPPDVKEQKELSDITAWLQSEYGKGKFCAASDKCKSLDDLEDVLRDSRDPKALREAWAGWRTVSPPMKPKYERFVELSNKGARDLGFADTADLWRHGYDMTPEEFSAELDRLYAQLKPLYASLHAYVRRRLIDKYGMVAQTPDGLIPEYLTGNMWGQSWENIYDIVAPPKSRPPYDLSERLKSKKYDEQKMVKTGEAFFTSLGFDPLPATFWERSMFTKPRDREVVCHASAWDVENQQDLRIKMCIKPIAEDFVTIHHELGHNFYQRAYKDQPYLFRGSANDGFHEALGDTIALSVTPEYLKTVGLIDKVPGAEGDIDLLLKMALDRVAFLPFGLMVDKWRWGVFTGEIKPADYNKAWWDLVRKYQGLTPAVARADGDFDPGAKYHVAANTPYARYFLAQVYEFQFYRALCKQHGYTGPLHRCSYYGDKQAGQRLNTMMAMGASRPWPEALEALTGQKQMDATAILEYFAPLQKWLDEQNKGQTVGWKE